MPTHLRTRPLPPGKLSRAPDPRPNGHAHTPPLATARRAGGVRPVAARAAPGGRPGLARTDPLVHPVPAPRRTQPARRLGHEARRPRRDPRRVQPDRHLGAWHPDHRTPPARLPTGPPPHDRP